MRIFLIRHGESIANTGLNEKLGFADHRVILTDKGKAQARNSAMALNQYILDHHVDLSKARAWFSPYDRTRETMEIFNGILHLDSHMDVREDISLTEQQFGMFDSLSDELCEELYPNEYHVWNTFKSQNGRFWARLPMGESPFDVAIRVKNFFGTIKRDYEQHGIDTLFIFTHGTTLRVFVMQYLHKTVEWYENESNPGNCWIRLIEEKEDKGYIYCQ